MKSNYKKLGEYIREVNIRNKDLQISLLLGVSISKEFIPSIANTVGTDFSNYKIVEKAQFAYGPVTSRNGDKISIALLKEDKCIISSSYMVFEIIDKSVLLPEYLMMWFRRPEFDRYARFKSEGSVREIFSWNELCNVELPVPDIDKQRKIVEQYNQINKAIQIKEAINNNLEQQAQAIFSNSFELNIDDNVNSIDKYIDVRDGTHDSPIAQKTGYPLITSKHLLPYGVNLSQANLISKADFNKINKRSCVHTGDILLSMIGTVGNISLIIEKEINFAVKNVALFKTSKITSLIFYVLCYLKSKKINQLIESKLLGSTQNYISLTELRNLPFIIPSEEDLKLFNKTVAPIFKQVICNSNIIFNLIYLRDTIFPKLMLENSDSSSDKLSFNILTEFKIIVYNYIKLLSQFFEISI